MDGSKPTPISAQDLYRSIGTAVAPVVIDVRRSAAFAADTRMIASAIRRNPDEVKDWRQEPKRPQRLDQAGPQRLEKKRERYPAAVAVYTDLAAAKNPYRVCALEELAKYYERRERNHAMALEMTRSALALEDSEPLRRREQRLKTRLAARSWSLEEK